ncbi:bifunctional diguanylate cyclase/phosphodiesterase [Priestia abyssalis]|uniref:bifunctional diguanylate cyclase/phosphodiesterase n=1 Tax=Priestia abyssalis TaxID=1221450 RepID=UPI000994CCEC|nr:EAL domain-containing protein [Priestia abyssalis]
MNHEHYLQSSYNILVVALSFVIAMVAAYTSFELANRVKASDRELKRFWLISGAGALGFGIWSMHFVGMLAFHLDMEIHYNLLLVALSVVWALLGCYGGLFFVHRSERTIGHLMIAGQLMGAGIGFMHYTGMEAMEPVEITYDPFLVLLSMVIAVTASIAALYLAFYSNVNNGGSSVIGKLGFSVLMAVAITGMHYMGMNAASFLPDSYATINSSITYYIDPPFFTLIVAIFTFIMFAVLFFTIFFDRRANQQQTMKGAIFEAAMDSIIVTSEQGVITNVNHMALVFLQRSKEEMIGQSAASFLSRLGQIDQLVGYRHEQVMMVGNGDEKIAEVTVTKVKAELGTEYIIYLRDMTEQKKFEQQMQETNNRYQSLFHSSPLAIVVHRNSQIVSINQEVLNIIGASSMDEVIGKGIDSFVACDEMESVQQIIAEMMETKMNREVAMKELKIYDVNGEERWITTKSNVIKINEEDYIQTVVRDITEQRKAKQTLHHMAFHDSLTGLPNRSLFDTLAQAVIDKKKGQEEEFAILFMDLDRFKQANDTHGHQAGDKILKEVARRLQNAIEATDILSRFGGDEFLLLVRRGSEDDVYEAARRLQKAIAEPFHVHDHEVYLHASIGISLYPKNGSTLDTLIRQADLAMYETKKAGRNGIIFYNESMQAHTTRRMLLEDGLRKAIANGEFELHYQPKIVLATGDITGMEALIRWHHPELGMVSPGEFIPIAEETELIIPLSEWTLGEACRQNKEWQDKGYPKVRVAVNISSIEFSQRSFVKTVVRILQKTGLEPQYLELEITESVAIKNIDDVIEKLEALKKIGVAISIDDFGSGYSSLSYLKKLPIDTLKIDRSFILDLSQDQRETSIVRAIIAIAQSLNLSVVAEGVELSEQVKILEDENCHEVQGYYFSKPLAVGQFEEWYENKNRPKKEGMAVL